MKQLNSLSLVTVSIYEFKFYLMKKVFKNSYLKYPQKYFYSHWKVYQQKDAAFIKSSSFKETHQKLKWDRSARNK